MSDKQWLLKLAGELDSAARLGTDSDEPEGARWIELSDTAARQIAARLRAIAAGVEVKDE